MTTIHELADLTMLARDCLTRAGVGEAAASHVACDVGRAEMAGDQDGGFSGLLRDIRLMRYGRLDPDGPVRITHGAAGVLRVDAGHGFAASAVAQAIPALIEMAGQQGLAVLHLTRASQPGALAGGLVDLAEAGFSAVSMRPTGHPFAIRSGHDRAGELMLGGRDTALDALLSLAPPAQDSPIGGAVDHAAWILAAEPEATGLSAVFDTLPEAPQAADATLGQVAVAPDLLAQIVNA